MNDPIDLLQIKIEKAKGQLPAETRQAIDAVDWKAVILGMRESKGYTFEQLGDLEIETELLLCGLLNPKDYPRELEARMKIPKARVNELVNEMNQLVFGKIREKLIKSAEREKILTPSDKEARQIDKNETGVLSSHGIEILPDLSTLELPVPVLAQKFSGSFQIPAVETEHSLENLSKNKTETPAPKMASYPNGADPYRLPPE